MKPMELILQKKSQASRFPNRRGAFSLFELLVIVAILCLLVALLPVMLAKARAKSSKIGCVNDLKQTGLSCLIFANDHDDRYPWQLSTNQGGSLELLALQPTVAQLFRSMSNELSTPKVLLCPNDATRTWATNWASLTDSNISYFIGLDARDTAPQMMLSGDRNLETKGIPVGSGLFLLSTNTVVGWTKAIHQNLGNVCLGDGSVQQLTSSRLTQQVQTQGLATNRLLIP